MTDGQDTSGLWYRVAELRPQLAAGARLYPQDYRGVRWYVLHDPANGRLLRVNRAAYELIARFDGDLTVEEIWEELVERRGDDAPTQAEVVALLAQLHAADALRTNLPIDDEVLVERERTERRGRWRRIAGNPLFLRIPLFDPDRLLGRLLPLGRAVFSRAGALVWLLVVGVGVGAAVVNWPAIARGIGADLLAPQSLVPIALSYLLLKALHELGHGLAAKVWGGEVHEVGVSLLVLFPLPYVDASRAWLFRSKHKRAMVAAAGIAVELFLAALALIVWLSVEPGIVRDLAFSLFLVGSLSTLLFNGNPLLRFDGYYVLEDLAEIPNLASRSNRYYQCLIQRWLLGIRDAVSPVQIASEARWFALYAPLAVAYRLLVLFGISLYLIESYLVVGVLLASWAVMTQVLSPIGRAMVFVARSPRLHRRRARSIGALAGVLGLVAAALLVVPFPLVTGAEGVVWVGDDARIHAGTDGFVEEVYVAPGVELNAGDPVLRLSDPLLDTQAVMLRAQLQGLEARRGAELFSNPAAAQRTGDRIAAVESELRTVEQRLVQLTLRSPGAGRLVIPDERELLGRFFPRGALIAYVLRDQDYKVRAVIPQDRIGLVRGQTQGTSVALAENLGEVLPARLVAEVPGAQKDLPSAALGTKGGGRIAVDPTDKLGLRAADLVFHVDLALPPSPRPIGYGGRAYVRFDHGSEPLGFQWYRELRQLLLRRVGV